MRDYSKPKVLIDLEEYETLKETVRELKEQVFRDIPFKHELEDYQKMASTTISFLTYCLERNLPERVFKSKMKHEDIMLLKDDRIDPQPDVKYRLRRK